MLTRLRSNLLAIGLMVPAVFGAAAMVARGQDAPAPKAEAKPAPTGPVPRTFDPSRRVPDYFGQIGLTPQQREQIYTIRGKHLAKIAELERQMTEARAAMLAECEDVLTGVQKQLLTERREAAREAREARRLARAAEAEPKPEAPAEAGSKP